MKRAVIYARLALWDEAGIREQIKGCQARLSEFSITESDILIEGL